MAELGTCPAFSLPRYVCATCNPHTSCTLYGFCNASKQTYAAVVYLGFTSPEGQIVRFLISKTRVAPIKTPTIPRLELLSVARLIKSVKSSIESEIQLKEFVCYTDSVVSLCWIRGVTRVWKQFVQHLVVEIRHRIPAFCWHHCPGVNNPADLPSRGASPTAVTCGETQRIGKEHPKVEMPPKCLEEL